MSHLLKNAEFFANSEINKNKIFQGVASKGDARKFELKPVLNAVFVWSGIICVIVIVVAGLMYILSSGDAGKVQKAKMAITYAIVGLVVIASAFAIVNFILGGI